MTNLKTTTDMTCRINLSTSKSWTCLFILLMYCRQCLADIFVIEVATNWTVDYLSDQPASFGPIIPPSGIQGYVIVSKPLNACSPVVKPPKVANFTGNWILLARRYNCTFMDKVVNAQNAGYDAVIIYNVPDNTLEHMSGDGEHDPNSIIIPSVFIGYDDGKIMSSYFKYEKGYYVVITDSLPFKIEDYLVPFAITVGVCFIFMLGFMAVKCVRDYKRSRRHRMSSRALKKLPIHKFKKGDPYECCAICLEDYVDNDRLRVLPCAHAYHVKCIDPWLTKNRRVCPVCKRLVLVGDERASEIESNSDDEQAPLIQTQQGTQGGTFDHQEQNPFQEAERQAHRRRRSRRSQRSSNHDSAESPNTTDTSDGEDSWPRAESTTPTSSHNPGGVAAAFPIEDEEMPVAAQGQRRKKKRRSRRREGGPSERSDVDESRVEASTGPVQIAVDVVNVLPPVTGIAEETDDQTLLIGGDGGQSSDYVV